MKPSLARITLGLFLLGTVLGSVPAARANNCSIAKGAGGYGFTLNGVLVLSTGPVPIAAVGRANLKADGTVSGAEARSVGGQYADETFKGTFSVNADCNGTATLEFFEDGQLVRTSVLAIVFDNNNREIRMVQKSLTLPNGAAVPVIVTVEAKEIAVEDEN